ncbi:hypothetical protein PI95_008910 [Hassallia byssoidea VB512170]|uniref:Uncharacterized protein n=1 Tax=Hassallia byssoidea VB512170 TaxID=1304833 RepID=A0A846H5K8_9CYAN|nr:hypothetical protein [Hassalia byssoidea]NEU72686.1 hypothetical protein [Hassalia byssoidea VB512170]
MSILTNRLKITFNIDAIKQDFVFIRLERQQNGKWYGTRELDYLIGKDFNAAAVMFQYGKYAYAMFKKPLDVYQFLSKIRENDKFKNNAVIEVTPKAILAGSEECICEAWLAQILLNSLSSSRSRFAKYHYCNLTGSLLLVRDFEGKNKDCLDVAKITLHSGYLLEIKTARHRTKISILTELKNTIDNKRKQELKNALDKPNYIFEVSTGSLRRHLPRDGEIDAKLIYIECGLKGKKASTPFLEFVSIDNFYKSSAGVFHHIMISIQEHLSKYMDVNFCCREIDDNLPLTNTLFKSPKQLHSKLDGQAIHIVDRVNDEDSADLAITLKELLLPYITDEKLITVGKGDKKDALNFRILHDADFYEKTGQKDEYLPSTDKFQRQHLTIESTINVTEAIVKTIIKEQLIKRDISSRTLNMFDWSKLKLKGVWTFAAWDEDENHVIFMEIEPNGNFEFYEIKDQNIFNWEKFEKYRKFMTDSSSGDKIRTLEGLVISDAGDINQIFRTDEITIPELSKIEAIINEVETEFPENKRSGNALAALIQEFMTESSRKDNEELVIFSDELQILGSNELDKKSFKKLLNQRLGKSSNISS